MQAIKFDWSALHALRDLYETLSSFPIVGLALRRTATRLDLNFVTSIFQEHRQISLFYRQAWLICKVYSTAFDIFERAHPVS